MHRPERGQLKKNAKSKVKDRKSKRQRKTQNNILVKTAIRILENQEAEHQEISLSVSFWYPGPLMACILII